MTSHASRSSSGSLRRAGPALGVAAVGGTVAFAALLLAGQVVALLLRLAVGVFDVWSWGKIGLLGSLLSLRAEVDATFRGSFAEPFESGTYRWRFVPFLLTLGFVWLAAGAGRRAARRYVGRSIPTASILAAAGAAMPVALLAWIAASLVTPSFPSLELEIGIDRATASVGAMAVVGAGAAAGATFERAGRGPWAAALRGGIVAYGVALALLVFVTLIVATLEPTATRGYVDALRGAGGWGAPLFGVHLLALPAQSALHLSPAAGACLAAIGDGLVVELCPWSLDVSGPVGELFLLDRFPLSPWLWLSNLVPPAAAVVGGLRAAAGRSGGRASMIGAASGAVFALTALLGAWFVAPRSFAPVPMLIPGMSIEPRWGWTTLALSAWGLAGGALGGWLAGRRYEEPGLPRPTSV